MLSFSFLLKDDFDETFGGMETALVEVQRRGKAMMNTVQIHLLLLKTIFQSLTMIEVLIFDNQGEEAERAAEQAGGRDGAGQGAEGGGEEPEEFRFNFLFSMLAFLPEVWHSGDKEAG